MIKFALPWFLLLYIPFLIIVLYALKRKKPTLQVPSIKPFERANPKRSLHITTALPFLLYILGSALLIIALARPQKGIEILKQKADGIDIMLAIDLSGSMTGVDIPPGYTSGNELLRDFQRKVLKTRLEIAKTEIRKFIKKRPNDRIGLIAFAPLPYVACPPTLDHAFLEEQLKQLNTGIIGDATSIAGPIASAVHRLKNADSKRKVLVLFTDGSNNKNARVTPRQAAKIAKTFDVIIYTVGIGSGNAYRFVETPYGIKMLQLAGEFDEQLLKDIAKISSGKYYTASDEKGLNNVMNEIDSLEKTTKEQPRYVDYKEMGIEFIIAGLVLLLTAFLLENTVFLRIP